MVCRILCLKEQNIPDFMEQISSQDIHIHKYSVTNETPELRRINIHVDGINKKRFSELFRLLSNNEEVKEMELVYKD